MDAPEVPTPQPLDDAVPPDELPDDDAEAEAAELAEADQA